jgi:alanine racemase
MQNTTVARIDLMALRHNLTVIRRLCPKSRIMAMVKADAYGHGLLSVAKSLDAADGFAVARLEEALLLRRSGIAQRILLLGTLLDESDLATCSEQRIDVTVHDALTARTVAAQARLMPLRVWLKLDSGMHRVGLTPEAFVETDRTLAAHPGVLELIHMTHFSHVGDGPTMESQLACFLECRRASSRAKVSLANSAALIVRSDTHADWVRPGIMLYGDNPLGNRYPVPIRPVMTLSSRIVAIREIEAGQSVGYNGRWISRRRSRIGTIGIGYGDGYPRHAGNGTPVWINGHLAPLVGQVSMDSVGVDLTDMGHVSVGDEAVLWGAELPAVVVAECANTISYQLFTSVSSRVRREYVVQPAALREACYSD